MKRTYYVLAVRRAWTSMRVLGALPVTVDSKANGYLLVYDNLEDLRAEWSDAPYFTAETGD